jgi:hypothetical protein
VVDGEGMWECEDGCSEWRLSCWARACVCGRLCVWADGVCADGVFEDGVRMVWPAWWVCVWDCADAFAVVGLTMCGCCLFFVREFAVAMLPSE